MNDLERIGLRSELKKARNLLLEKKTKFKTQKGEIKSIAVTDSLEEIDNKLRELEKLVEED